MQNQEIINRPKPPSAVAAVAGGRDKPQTAAVLVAGEGGRDKPQTAAVLVAGGRDKPHSMVALVAGGGGRDKPPSMVALVAGGGGRDKPHSMVALVAGGGGRAGARVPIQEIRKLYFLNQSKDVPEITGIINKNPYEFMDFTQDEKKIPAILEMLSPFILVTRTDNKVCNTREQNQNQIKTSVVSSPTEENRLVFGSEYSYEGETYITIKNGHSRLTKMIDGVLYTLVLKNNSYITLSCHI
jgi:hypothetical protein